MARAVVASSTSKIDSADTPFKDRIKISEPGVSDVANNACDIHITITIRVEKDNDLTVSQSHMSTQKKAVLQKAMTLLQMTHQKKEAKPLIIKFDFPTLLFRKIKEKAVL